ncbi:hypothetical protein BDZ94DRAFT_232497 [Collybia nuda]|uniref:Uncharacterized protein n=1 Tax=Collybia nuda TaxID=64659 RepID=A0A9P6C9J0_9AGAR|nr:hypothetical protein BDZ94DRAFT_232497 [Collybia nuda]
MGEMNPSQLHYVEVMCESLLHGAFTVLIAVVIWLLVQRRQMPKVHKFMFGAGIIMWMLSSAHLGLVIQQVTNVETPLRNAQAQVSIATIQLLIGDMILLWRVWTVWGQNYWITIIPLLLVLAAAGVRFAVVASIAGVLEFASDQSTAIIVANTLLCTILIAGRIWYLQWRMNRLLGYSPSEKSKSAYRGVLMLIIESGLLYALIMLLSLILDDIHNDGIHTVLDMQIPIIGILPTLIVLVVHFDLVPGTNATEKYHAAMVSSKFHAASGNGPTASATIGSWRAAEVSTGQASTLDDGLEIKQHRGKVHTATDYSDQEGMV